MTQKIPRGKSMSAYGEEAMKRGARRRIDNHYYHVLGSLNSQIEANEWARELRKVGYRARVTSWMGGKLFRIEVRRVDGREYKRLGYGKYQLED
jgi:hypothetical protein